MRVAIVVAALICMLVGLELLTSIKSKPQAVEFGGNTPQVLCARFGGVSSSRWEDRLTETKREIRWMAECADGSSVWRWAETKR